jgi:tetratricopeptide (TPR) repeat protein
LRKSTLCSLPAQPPKQADDETNAADRERALSARQALEKFQAGQGTAADRWDRLFSDFLISDSQLAATIQILHEDRKYDEAIGCLESAIRNGRAATWLYDLLALEMQLAGRPAEDIGRVLQSRLDFGIADVPQMLLTAALLSRFEAWDAAITLLRDAAQLNPDSQELWLLARSVADKSKDREARVWARCGILQYVWNENYGRHHDEAIKVLKEIAAELDRTGQSPAAESVRARLASAQRIDLQITVKWVGNADIDLIVTDPNQEECSYRRRKTSSLGRLVREDGGVEQKPGKPPETRIEQFVQPIAVPGRYEFSIRFVVGRIASGTAVVEVVQNAGTPQETRETKTVQLAQEDVRLSTEVKSRQK